MGKGTVIKTTDKTGKAAAPLKYVFIKGDGRNNAMPGEEPKMMFVASACVPEGSPIHEAVKDAIYSEWEKYKKEHNVKGMPAKNKHGHYMDGMKPEMVDDPEGEIDPDTEKVKKVPTGNILITFKTNVKWPDGKPMNVKVFDKNGKDITTPYQNAAWSIGEGSTGVVHGKAIGNNVGGTHKVTLYLSAVQLGKLVKYEGDVVETTELDGDDIEFDMETEGVGAIDSDTPTDTPTPELE